ncbi:hypothetical protein R1flu_017619 [Riccia fluitans]|uniref:Uncharacterized protein n=1 Tax=Riccia fluitans TaxID=41844 RepID=A0ABD1ZFV0_9MARC
MAILPNVVRLKSNLCHHMHCQDTRQKGSQTRSDVVSKAENQHQYQRPLAGRQHESEGPDGGYCGYRAWQIEQRGIWRRSAPLFCLVGNVDFLQGQGLMNSEIHLDESEGTSSSSEHNFSLDAAWSVRTGDSVFSLANGSGFYTA